MPSSLPNLPKSKATKSALRHGLRRHGSKDSGSTIGQGPLDVAVGKSQRDGAVAVRLLQRAIAEAHGAAANTAVRLLLARNIDLCGTDAEVRLQLKLTD